MTKSLRWHFLSMRPGVARIWRFLGFRLIVASGLSFSVAAQVAPSGGMFIPTGKMVTRRTAHTATLLNDGRVLFTGGTSINPSSVLSDAELYDPATGAFSPTGSMMGAHQFHTATLLADGRVLIAGGYSSNGARGLGMAEIYDPATGTFTATGNMVSGRREHSATLLRDGRVLISGGIGTFFEEGPEFYDPDKGEFTAAGDVKGTGLAATATRLSNGKVLGVGGRATFEASLYDPDSRNFSFFTWVPYPEWFNYHTAVLLANGQVLVAGGANADYGDGARSEAFVYDAVQQTIRRTEWMLAERVNHTATLLPDRSVLIVGGFNDYGTIASAELYHFWPGYFERAARMSSSRYGHTATLLRDGRVLIAGGTASELAEEIYIPAVLTPAPALLSVPGDGNQQGAILHGGAGRIVSPADPAAIGEAIEIYCTGLADFTVVPPQVTIGGRIAEVLFFGTAPGFVDLNQVNVRIPAGVKPGAAVSVRLIHLDRPSNEVTIGVQ